MKMRLGGLTVALSFLVLAPAYAAPATVTVRVEGPTSTLLEAAVTTDVRTFHFTGGGTEYQCDSTSAGPAGAVPSPTRNVALMVAGEQTGTEVLGSFGSFGASFSSIGGVGTGFDAATNRYLVEYKNGRPADIGGCGDAIATGDDVLYAYGDGTEASLKLAAPATAAPGAAVPAKVTDAGSGAAVAGARVGAVTTAADGGATIGPFANRGPQPALKATKTGAIRSNAVSVCVTDGADGFCGTTKPGDPPAPAAVTPPCAHDGNDGRCGTVDLAAPRGQIVSVKEQQRFTRGKGPRTLVGSAFAATDDVRDIAIRLTKSVGPRAFGYSAASERFVRLKRFGAGGGTFFPVTALPAAGFTAKWSYLLPAKLARGRYVLDVRVTDRAGNVDGRLDRGRSRVVFYVR